MKCTPPPVTMLPLLICSCARMPVGERSGVLSERLPIEQLAGVAVPAIVGVF